MSSKKAETLPVRHKTLLGRVGRALKQKGQRLRADHRGGPTNFFLVDTNKDTIIRANVDLCDIARKLKVIRPWERLELK
jgi:hypothetical protein